MTQNYRPPRRNEAPEAIFRGFMEYSASRQDKLLHVTLRAA
jgi:hypothetical protein